LKHILLVEDEVFIREVAREILESVGYAVTEAGDGLDGLNAFLDSPGKFDLIILDLVMPRMHGFEVMDRIRQVSTVPILLSSGYSPEGRPEVLHPSTSVGFLAKPYRTRDLIIHVARLLEPGPVTP
jgi:CheY-like chemotaxis protein